MCGETAKGFIVYVLRESNGAKEPYFSHNEVQHDGVVNNETLNDNLQKHGVFQIGKGAGNDLEESLLY